MFKLINLLFKKYPNFVYLTYAYALVYLTPLSVPFVGWTLYQGAVTQTHFILFLVFYALSGLGITLGYHRLATHRAFGAKSWVKCLFLFCGTLAMQGSPATWASIHIKHHRFSDKPGDPHSPINGLWHAHCGWLFDDYSPDFERYGKWLLEDKIIVHFSKYYLLYGSLGLIIPYLVAGWTGLLWGGFFRLFFTCHVTWSVNSICHHFGKKEHKQIQDESRNNVWVALLTFGEGWHNNHHRFMQMPFLGHKWYQLDVGKLVLILFNRLGWVNDLKIPREYYVPKARRSTV